MAAGLSCGMHWNDPSGGFFPPHLYVSLDDNRLAGEAFHWLADMRLECRWEIPEASCRLPNILHWSGMASYCPIAAVDAQVFDAMNS